MKKNGPAVRDREHAVAHPTQSRQAAWVAVAAACVASLEAPPAEAHQTGLAFLDLSVEGEQLKGTFDVPAPDLARKLGVDANRNGEIEATDIAASEELLGDWLAGAVRIATPSAVCTAGKGTATLRNDQVVTLHTTWRCPAPADRWFVASRLAQSLGDGQALFVQARRGEQSVSALLNDESSGAELSLSAGAGAVAKRFALLGLEHIATGYDHLLFLLTLLLMGGSLRRIVGIATSFTVAHSVTLSAAALGGVPPVPSRVVESLIALSIAYVAVENHLGARAALEGRPEPLALRWRWLVTFAFGLVHGFGFSGALSEIGLPSDAKVLALGMFNVGVEAGQLAVIVVAWPLVTRAMKQPWFLPRAIPSASLGIFGLAVYWFVQRAF